MTRVDTKEDILKKTFFLMLTKGYDGVSITDIQNYIGISRGLVYHHFGSKKELFLAAGEKFFGELFITSSKENASLPEMIRHTIGQYRRLYKEWSPPSAGEQITIADFDFLTYQLIDREKRLAKLYSDMRRTESSLWTKAAAVSIGSGEIRNVIGPEKIARHMMAILDGVWMEAVDQGKTARHISSARQALEDYYELLKV